MRKEKAVRAVNMRLTESEHEEYLRLGGIKWIRLFLKQSVEMYKMLEIEKHEQREKTEIKRRIRRAAQNSEPRGATGVVAVPKSVWQVVGKAAPTASKESDRRV